MTIFVNILEIFAYPVIFGDRTPIQSLVMKVS